MKTQTIVLALLLGLILSACNPNDNAPSTEEPDTPAPNCKILKSVWESTTDDETHDWRGLSFTFLYVPYTYTGSDNTSCSQDMRWYGFTPAVNGASFEMEFQNNNPLAGCDDWQLNGSTTQGRFYIAYQCTSIRVCNEGTTVCKTFE